MENPNSIRFAAELMLGQWHGAAGSIGSSTLAYLQMAVYALDEGAGGEATGLQMLEVLDNIMAFRAAMMILLPMITCAILSNAVPAWSA